MNKGRPFGGPGAPVNGAGAFQPAGVARWLGRLPTRTAMLMLIAGAVLGVIFSLMAGQEPGVLLGFFIVVGSIAAVLGIQRGKAYLLFPMPALMSFVAAIAIGKVHDSNLGSSTAGLASGFTQWVAGIFFPAVVATLMVVLIGGGRWLLGRQLITGQSMLSPGGPARPSPPRGNARVAPGPRPRRPAASGPARNDPARNDPDRNDPDRDAWADDNPFGEQQAFKTEMIPAVRQDQPAKPDRPAWMGRSGGAARQAPRPPRDRGQRTDRDPWGDPRLPPDRAQGTGPRPSAQPQPRDGSSPRPSFNPSPNPPRPQRPQRRQPPEGWNPR